MFYREIVRNIMKIYTFALLAFFIACSPNPSIDNPIREELTQYKTLLQAVSEDNYGPFWLGSQKVVANVTSYDKDLGKGNSFNPEKLISQFDYLGLSGSLPLAKDGWIQQIWIGGKQATILYMGQFIYAKTSGNVVYRLPFSKEEIVNEENVEIESIAIELEPGMSLESVFETNDGSFIAQCVNTDQSSENYKTRFLYKVKVDDELNAEAIFLFKCVESTVNACGVREHWSFKQYGSRILISPYGGGRTGQLWLSDDYGDSFNCIFNIANTKTFVATKPNDIDYGAFGIHPLPDQMIPPQKEDFWESVSEIGNGNRHIHSCCYDDVFDRIWLVMGDDKYQATGIYWSDDLGKTWHRKSLFFNYSEIDKGRHTQFLQVVSLNNCVLFGTDGWGNGIFRYNRGNKEDEPEIEYVFGWSENKLGLEGVANHTIVTDEGIVLMTFAPNSKKAAPTGGIVATDGYHFRKVFLDTYNNNTLESMKIGWTTFLHINGHDLYIRTKDKKELIVVENFI